jgi:hypothetical protein
MAPDLHQTWIATAAEPPFHAKIEEVWDVRGARTTRSAVSEQLVRRPARPWIASAATP